MQNEKLKPVLFKSVLFLLFAFLNFYFNYSVLKLFTGFDIAARIDLYPTVIQAITTEHITASINTQTVIFILKAKF